MAKMDDSRLPKKVMYSTLTHQPKATGTTMDFRQCIRKDLEEFGLTTADDLASWLKKASSENWEDDVLEGREMLMIKFFKEEDRQSNRRALLELPYYPPDYNKINASYLRMLQELPYFDDPEVTKSNKRTLLELPFYGILSEPPPPYYPPLFELSRPRRQFRKRQRPTHAPSPEIVSLSRDPDSDIYLSIKTSLCRDFVARLCAILFFLSFSVLLMNFLSVD
jgi:hypothetical protein